MMVSIFSSLSAFHLQRLRRCKHHTNTSFHFVFRLQNLALPCIYSMHNWVTAMDPIHIKRFEASRFYYAPYFWRQKSIPPFLRDGKSSIDWSKTSYDTSPYAVVTSLFWACWRLSQCRIPWKKSHLSFRGLKACSKEDISDRRLFITSRCEQHMGIRLMCYKIT